MQRWRGLEATPGDLGRTVVTIGMYDGVHRGHQALIGAAVARARAMRRPCLLLTFDPHPAEVVRPGSHPAILTAMDRKAELVAELGVDAICVLPFTPEFMRLPPSRVHAHRARRAAARRAGRGGRELPLRPQGRRHRADARPPRAGGSASPSRACRWPRSRATDDGDVTISSTYVRACVAAGDWPRPPGRWAGRTGSTASSSAATGAAGSWASRRPTWRPRYTAIPADGVYAGHLVLRDASGASGPRHPAAISVGTNPTFQGSRRTVEAFVLDFDGDLYGEHVGVEFVSRLRPMAAFAGVEQLVEAMAADVERTRQVLGVAGS